MKIQPFHSKLASDPPVHHNNDACTEAKAIEARNRAQGTGGRPLCEH
jgi:hypothetical protein